MKSFPSLTLVVTNDKGENDDEASRGDAKDPGARDIEDAQHCRTKGKRVGDTTGTDTGKTQCFIHVVSAITFCSGG